MGDSFAQIGDFLTGTKVIDDASYVEGVNALVAARAAESMEVYIRSDALLRHMDQSDPFQLHAILWLGSKYANSDTLLDIVTKSLPHWKDDSRLGRMVGGLYPRFISGPYFTDFEAIVRTSNNFDALSVMTFHSELSRNAKIEQEIRKYVRASNPTKALKITHAKMLVTLTVLSSPQISSAIKKEYIDRHAYAWRDPFYAATAQALAGSRLSLEISNYSMKAWN